jgi:hypothetical protein
MPAASILPVAMHNGKLYFLFGKENPMEDSAKGFSDFGGGIDNNDTPIETAIREGCEELTGFLGTKEMLRKRLRKTGTYKMLHMNEHKIVNGKPSPYTIFIFPFPYDTGIVEYFNNNHSFLWNRMDKKMLNKSKLFEKIQIDWFCEDELEKRMSEYRSFYCDIVRDLIREKDKIRRFIKLCYKKHPGTLRKNTEARRRCSCCPRNATAKSCSKLCNSCRTRRRLGGK